MSAMCRATARAFVAVALAGLLAGCGPYSLRESSVRAKMPLPYKDHATGIIVRPDSNAVAEALSFGRSDKEGRAVEYAYIFKPALSFYVTIETPLYLIARHARLRAREYRDVDEAFVRSCRELAAVQILLHEQLMTEDWHTRAIAYDLILLRNGQRVEPMERIPAYDGSDPFLYGLGSGDATLDALSRETRAVQQETERLLRIAGDSRPVMIPAVPWTFRASDLALPGSYEVVYRPKGSTSVFAGGTEEKRFSLDLRSFR